MKWKRPLAFLGVLIIAGLYISALIAAFVGSAASRDFLLAAIFCTVAVPVMIYACQILNQTLTRKKESSDKSDSQ